jgi:hypothetical protein
MRPSLESYYKELKDLILQEGKLVSSNSNVVNVVNNNNNNNNTNSDTNRYNHNTGKPINTNIRCFKWNEIGHY